MLNPEQKLAELKAALGGPPLAWPELFGRPPANAGLVTTAPAPIWQGALFQQFVLGTLADPLRRSQGFSSASVNGWTVARFGVDDGEARRGLIAEVARFLSHLVANGYLRFPGDKYFVVRDFLPAPSSA